MNIQIILNSQPKNYILLKNAMTAPKGTKWYYNAKSLFNGEFKAVLVKEQQNER